MKIGGIYVTLITFQETLMNPVTQPYMLQTYTKKIDDKEIAASVCQSQVDAKVILPLKHMNIIIEGTKIKAMGK